ncbi:hypothetical protein [Paracoccus jiaweipingae]|uniref:hypothetical protein n=1 Tax=unclassified Paracoccus (in: a-proteobacteria) TaxID=2688777 RepID=UPI0037BD6F97
MLRSRVVALLKVLLPLAALALLSTLFLLARQPGGDGGLPYADVRRDAMQGDAQIRGPHFSSVTSDGAMVALSAEQATPGAGGGAASEVVLNWQSPDGLSADLTAPAAQMRDGLIGLTGGVRMQTSNGWRLDSDTLSASTDHSLITADGGVRGTGPLGRVEAGQMQLRRDADGQAVLDLTGGVHLIYRP